MVGYAFTYFDALEDRDAELWFGFDEAILIYLNGEIVYDYNRYRSYSVDKFYTSKEKVTIQEGENTLLVKVSQNNGSFNFSLNICEPETDIRYDKNRVWGLKFRTKL